MYKIALLDERQDLFTNVSAKTGLDTAIIEKDFWVCFVLDYLFTKSKYKDNLIFKGGTSLSKAYNIIERFSEDIDLILDWRVVGFGKDEPWIARSKTQQDKFNKIALNKEKDFLNNEFLPAFKQDLEETLKQKLNIYTLDKDDDHSIYFEYPRKFDNSSILKCIKLEIGILASWVPQQNALIKPYVADFYPHLFSISSTTVKATVPERTFWEKATILHREANRSAENSLVPERYSRHYYDLYCLAKSGILKLALAQPELLNQVSEFKQKFYPCKWAKYEDAKIGSLKLYPPNQSIQLLKQDYKKMEEMIYGDYPDFDKILDYISKIEKEINNKN